MREDRYEGEKKAFAQAALLELESTELRETTDAYVGLAYRVATVERCASEQAFRMEVRLYTIFGIPYGEKKVPCTAPLPG